MNEGKGATANGGSTTEPSRKLGLSWNIYLSQADLWMKSEVAEIALAEKRSDSCIVKTAVEEYLNKRKKKKK